MGAVAVEVQKKTTRSFQLRLLVGQRSTDPSPHLYKMHHSIIKQTNRSSAKDNYTNGFSVAVFRPTHCKNRRSPHKWRIRHFQVIYTANSRHHNSLKAMTTCSNRLSPWSGTQAKQQRLLLNTKRKWNGFHKDSNTFRNWVQIFSCRFFVTFLRSLHILSPRRTPRF